MLLDFEGGLLSLVQLLMDSGVTKVRSTQPAVPGCSTSALLEPLCLGAGAASAAPPTSCSSITALLTFRLAASSLHLQDWSPVTGNPVKFGLGFTSMFFDVIFMLQHYCLYRERAPATPTASYPTEVGV